MSVRIVRSLKANQSRFQEIYLWFELFPQKKRQIQNQNFHAIARHMLSIMLLDVHVKKCAAYSVDISIVLVLESNDDSRFLNLANTFFNPFLDIM